MQQFFAIDTSVFFLINHLPHIPVSDFIAESLSGFGNALILWLVIAAVLFFLGEKKDSRFWISFCITGILSYLFSEIIGKTVFMRVRPIFLSEAIISSAPPMSYSFPSTHATVAFAFSYLFSHVIGYPLFFYPVAILVSLSRVYLGHHYLSDVLGGAVLGILIGMISVCIEHIDAAGIFPSVWKKGKTRKKQV